MGSVGISQHLGGQQPILGRPNLNLRPVIFTRSLFLFFGVEEHYRVTLLDRIYGCGITCWAADMASVCIWIR